ncbi:MAG: tetratricopeptide repeat protein [Candidatus Omnitrophica bacterium]|nr:tetratricopeptide repeat protein [Candidatus Omnitrophota bacterium]
MKRAGFSISWGWITAVAAVLALSGCVDPGYRAERLFWQAERKADEVFKKGIDNFTDEDFETLIGLYRKVVEAAPLEDESSQAQFIIADLYTYQHKYRKAQQQLLQIENNFFTKPVIASRAKFFMAKLYEKREKPEEAIQYYEELMSKYPVTPIGLTLPRYLMTKYKEEGSAGKAREFYDRAITHYQDLLSQYTDTAVAPTVYDALAELYLAEGEPEKALEMWDRIILDYPESGYIPKAYTSKAETYVRQLSHMKNAQEVYEQFSERYPDFPQRPEIELRLARLYLQDDKTAKAKRIYREIINEFPEKSTLLAQAYAGLAECYQKEANTGKMEETYGYIREHFPDSQAAFMIPFLTARYYEQTGFHQKAQRGYRQAAKKYEQYLAKHPDPRVKKEAANVLTLCYIKTNRVSDAVALLEKLSTAFPRDPMYLFDLATLYVNLHKPEKAREVYQTIQEKYPTNYFVNRLAQRRMNTLR